MIYPIRKSVKAKVVDGRETSVQEETWLTHIAVLTPWAPVEVKLALTLLPALDEALIIGSKSRRDRLGIGVLVTLKEKSGGEPR